MWWGNNEQRKIQKEKIKNKIKQTKLSEKSAPVSAPPPPSGLPTFPPPPPPTTDGFPEAMSHDRGVSVDSLEYDLNRPIYPDPHDPFAQHWQNHFFAPTPYQQYAPYEVDIRTERQMFVNDVPTRRDSTISTYTSSQQPQHTHPSQTLPPFPEEDWVREELFESRRESFGPIAASPTYLDPELAQQSYFARHANIPVDDADRPLLDHFIDNVLRLLFPILELNQQQWPARAKAILTALETNRYYLHCCLSISAVHLKATEGITGEQIDQDIMRHRFETVSELCKALDQDTCHDQILDAALGMIFFQCSVGRPDDCLPDIPWHQHFQAVTSLVHKLDLQRQMIENDNLKSQPPFNMALTSWVDILGSTMLGKTPQFADTYRTLNLTGTSSGLSDLMGCDDRILYLISEISCLDALKTEGHIDAITVCSHVTSLGQHLDITEPPASALDHPYSSEGTILPEQLSKNISAIFSVAARIYLCSLVPDFDKSSPSTYNLVSAVADALQYIPSGPQGFDRSLVWPILMAGAFSVPSNPFRRVFAERVSALGEHAEFGSFGRMARLLREVWRLADDPEPAPTSPSRQIKLSSSPPPPPSTPPMAQQQDNSHPSPPPSARSSPGVREIKKQHVHWRDVMHRNGWEYLLI